MPATMQHSHASAIALAAMLLAPSAMAAEAAPGASSPAPATTAQAAVRIAPECANGRCDYKLTRPQMLALADKLVREKKYDEARSIVAALSQAPEMAMPSRFLAGLIAMETGDPEKATEFFRAILKDHPEQTRVRLELARALMMQSKFQSADYHLRLAENDEDLPEDIARQIGNVRSIIRTNRKFRFGFDFGFAPDTNINSATTLETVDINFGPQKLPIELDDNARAQSGLGLTASAYGSVRLPVADRVALVTDVNVQTVTYEQSDFNDHAVQAAFGPEFALGEDTQLSVQGLGLYRWFGGRIAARQFGAKATLQHRLDRARRLAIQIDGRRSESDINAGFDGWQAGATATYEQVIGTSALASASLIARRDWLEAEFFSSKTIGANLGIGAELPWGINAGLSGGATLVSFDAPQLFFSEERREDWRFDARAYAGLRQVRFAGFSPSVEYNFQKVDSNYALYGSDRHRFLFKLARYF